MWRRPRQARSGKAYPDPEGDARAAACLSDVAAFASPKSESDDEGDTLETPLNPPVRVKYVRYPKPPSTDGMSQITLAETEAEAEPIETYADLDKQTSSRLLCEECEVRPAVARCTSCQETLCARCFVLIHPPRPGGNEHDHLRFGKVRALCADDTSGALAGTHHGTLSKGGARLCFELGNGMTSELTEADLEARGVDLTVPVSLEAPLINYCAGDVERDVYKEAWRQGEVVLVVSSEADREDNSSDEEVAGSGVFAARKRRGPKLFRRKRERWGLLVDVPGRTFTEPTKAETQYALPKKPPVVIGDGAVRYCRVQICGPCSGDYVKECTAASDERLIHRVELDDARRTRTGFVNAAQKGYVEVLSRDFRAPLPIQVPAELKLELVREEFVERSEVRRTLLVEARRVACSQVLRGVDRRFCNQIKQGYVNDWRTTARRLRRAERNAASSQIQLNYKNMRMWRMLEALEQAAVDAAYEATRKIHKRFNYVTDSLRFSECYTTDGSVYFETQVELNEYMHCLREKCNLVATKWTDRGKQFVKLYFLRWRQEAFWARDQELVGETHFESLTTKQRRELEEAILHDKEAMRERVPWHPAQGIDLPELPEIGGRRGEANQLIVEDEQVNFDFKMRMKGPADVSNWVVPGLLSMGAYPSGPKRLCSQRDFDFEEDEIGCAGSLVFNGVRVFVDLMPEDEARIHADGLGDQWARIEGAGRKLLMQDEAISREAQVVFGEPQEGLGAVSCALQAILDRTHTHESGVLVKASTNHMFAQQEVKRCVRYEASDPRFEDAEKAHYTCMAKLRLAHSTMSFAQRRLKKLPHRLRTIRYAIPPEQCGEEATLIKVCESIEKELRIGVGVYVYSRLGHGRSGMLCALLLGRLYGLRASEALWRIQLYHDCRRTVEVAKSAFSCPQTLGQRALVERCLLHTDAIYGTVKRNSRWQGAKFSGAPRNKGVPSVEDLKVRDEPRDARDRVSYLIRRSEQRPWRSQGNFDEGELVEEAPSRLQLHASPVKLVQSSTMRSLRPRTVKQELDVAKKKLFVRSKLPSAEKTIEALEAEEEAERERVNTTGISPYRSKKRADSVENW